MNVTNLSRQELMELAQISERWGSDLDTRFYLYEPNPIMKKFHQSPAKVRALFGGNRSGKTYASLIECCAQFLGRAPRSLEGIIPQQRLDPHRAIRHCSIDYPNNFIKVTWPYIQQLIPDSEITDVLKDSGRIKSITNRYGGFIEFMVYESDVSKFQGASRHCIFYDEEPPQAIRDENLMRLVDTNGEEVFAMTPINEANYGASSRWMYDEIVSIAGRTIEMVGNEINVKSSPEGDSDIDILFANIYDNKAISKEAADRILSKFGKEEREVRERGHFLFLSGLVYKEFNDTKHLIDASELDNWWKSPDYTLYIAIDPHPRTPHAAIFWVTRRDGLHFIVDELFAETNSAAELVEMIKVKQRGKTANVILIDPSGFIKDPSTGSCFAYDLADAGLFPIPIEGSKDLSRGILRVRELLSGTQRGPLVYISRDCKRLRYELTHYTWDSWKKDTANIRGEKQKPVDKDDHLLECLRRISLLSPEWILEQKFDDEDDDLKRRRN